MNPYKSFVSEIETCIQRARSHPLGGFDPAPRPVLPPNAPKALFFAPHPDDECIVGGIAVRLMREAKLNLLNVAVTQGSKKERQAERLHELKAACNYLGFGLLTTGPNGLENVNPRTRAQAPNIWRESVGTILRIMQTNHPRVILFPHEHDWNSTHIGTHFLLLDALQQMPVDFECYLVETEFWGQMTDPNLMVEISGTDLADMITATTFHVGEVKRNPYHLLLPAWMLDNVRRGTELVGGQGGVAPNFTFAALYRLRRWRNGNIEKLYEGGKNISAAASISELFP